MSMVTEAMRPVARPPLRRKHARKTTTTRALPKHQLRPCGPTEGGGGQLRKGAVQPRLSFGQVEHRLHLLGPHPLAAHPRMKVRVVELSAAQLADAVEHLVL